MPINEFDDAVDKLSREGGLDADPRSAIDSAVRDLGEIQKSSLQSSTYVAKNLDPSRTAKVLEISKREGFEPSFVERNFDYLSKRGPKEAQYEELVRKAPGLAKWMERPEYAAIARGDEENLAQIDRAVSALSKAESKEKSGLLSLPGEYLDAGQQGYFSLNENMSHLSAALGFVDPDVAAEASAEFARKRSEIVQKQPSYMDAFQAEYEKQSGDIALAKYRAENGLREMRSGLVGQGLVDMTAGGLGTIGEFLELAKLLKHPRATGRFIVENLVSSAPAAVLGGAGAVLGGGLPGLAIGTFSGTSLVEFGATVNELIASRGYDMTNPDSLRQAYRDRGLMDDIRAQAARKALTQASVATVFSLMAGKDLAKAGVKGSLGQRVVSGAKALGKDLARETIGEGVEEASGRLAQFKGDVTQIDIGDIGMEMIGGFGQSVAATATGAATRIAEVRSKLPANAAEATIKVSEEVDATVTTLNFAEIMQSAGKALQSSKANELSAESVSELVRGVGNGNSVVYFQKEDWDNYFRNRDLSPVKVLEEISDRAKKSYDMAQETDGVIAVPMSEFLTKTAKSEHFESLLQIARKDPDSKSLIEAAQFAREMPDIVRALAQEAATTKEQVRAESVTDVDRQMAEVEARAVEQLVASGEKTDKARKKAKVLGSFLRAVSSRSEFSVKELSDKYGFNVSRGTGVTKEGETLNQSEVSAPPTFSKLQKVVEEKMAGGGSATAEQVKSWISEIKAEERKWSGIDEFLKGKDKVAKHELEMFLRANELQIETITLDETKINRRSKYAIPSVLNAIRESEGDVENIFLTLSNDGSAYEALTRRFPELRDNEDWAETVVRDVIEKDGTARHGRGDLVLPGGENYREVLFRLPSGNFDLAVLFVAPTHFTQTNILAHVRLNDRIDKNGQRVLFAEEIQSDWHQEGRNKGYKSEGGTVADAPFKNNAWAEYALKRLVRMAVEQGYDKVSWTTGQQQVERYTKGRMSDEMRDRITRGMPKFYDEIVVNAANKLVKKFGIRVEKTTLSNGIDVHSITLNDKIKDVAVKEGFSLFQENRGRITIGPNRQLDIELLAKADDSTFLHELGHAFLEVMADVASLESSDPKIQSDFKSLLDWFGVKDRSEIKREHHEMFARGFEKFLLEGRAPSKRLREVFHDFRLWLINVYKGLVGLDVELTPEVKSVMGRMLATEEELTKVANEKRMKALFSDLETFGLRGEKADKYIDAVKRAEQDAIEDFNGKMFENFREKKRKFLKEERQRVRSEIESGMDKTPGGIAMRTLIGKDIPEGAQRMKLDRPTYSAAFGADQSKLLPKGVFESGGFDPDTAAAFFGFTSGRALHEALIAETKREQTISALVEARMVEEYGDLIAQADMSDEAYRSLQNNSRTKLLEMELDILASENLPVFKDLIRETTRRSIITAEEVKVFADAALGEMRIGDIKPRRFEIAELKFSTLAGEALTKGDREASFIAKRSQLINHQLYKRSVAIEREVEKFRQKNKDMWKKDEDLAKSRDLDYVNAARAMLAHIGQGRTDKTASDYLAKTKAYDQQTYETIAAMVSGVMEQTEGKELHDLSYDEFSLFKSTVESLWHLSREVRQFSLENEKIELDAVIDQVTTQIQKNVPLPKSESVSRTVSEQDKLRIAYDSGKATLRIMNSLADEIDRGDRVGVANKVFIKKVKEATANYRAAKKETIAEIEKILRPIKDSLRADPIEAKELADEAGRPMVFQGQAELFGAILHIGNQSNLSKLLRGRKWGNLNPDGSLNTSRWDAFLDRMFKEGRITKEHMDAAQAIWDLFERLKPDVQKAHKRMYGHYFNEVTAAPVLTPYGEYRGGYFPARSDPYEVDRAESYELKEMMEKNATYAFPTAGRGATKTRIERYAAPLSLNVRLVMTHADWALRFAHIEPEVREVGRLVKNDRFLMVANKHLPRAAKETIIPYLQRAVTQRVAVPSGTPAVVQFIDRAMTKVRRNTAFAVMFGNVVNAAKQVTGLSVSASYKIDGTRIGFRLRNAMMTYLRDPKGVTDFIASKSKEMENRLIPQVLEMQNRIDEYIVNPSKFQKFKDAAYNNAYILQSATQGPVDKATWMSAYALAIEKGHADSDAVFIADKAVLTTQGSSNPEDVSSFIGSTPIIRSLVMFQNYNSMIGNYLVTETKNDMRSLGLKKGFGGLFTTYSLTLLVPAILSAAITRLGAGRFDEDDDDEYMDDAVDVFIGEPLRSTVGLVPVAGQLAELSINRFDNKWYNDTIRMSPAIQAFDAGASLPATTWKLVTEGEIKKKNLKDGFVAINAFLGIPIAPVSRPIGYAYSVASGEEEPKNIADFIRGLAVGR